MGLWRLGQQLLIRSYAEKLAVVRIIDSSIALHCHIALPLHLAWIIRLR